MSPPKSQQSLPDNASWKDRVAVWIGAQEFNNVLLLTIIALMAAGGHYTVKEAIPAHLRMIQEGYDRIDAKHAELMQERGAATDKQIERIVSGFEKVVEQNNALIRHIIENEPRRFNEVPFGVLK